MPKTKTSAGRKAPQKPAPRRPKTKSKTRTKSPLKAARKPTRRIRKGNTLERHFTGLLPRPIDLSEYMRRTMSILEEGEKKHANLRKRQVRQLGDVLTDFQNDVTANITAVERSTQRRLDRLTHRVRSTRLVQEAILLPERITDTFDGVLGRVGLVRRSLYLEAAGE